MHALQIRDVPDDIRKTFAERASRRGQSAEACDSVLVTADRRLAGAAGIGCPVVVAIDQP